LAPVSKLWTATGTMTNAVDFTAHALVLSQPSQSRTNDSEQDSETQTHQWLPHNRRTENSTTKNRTWARMHSAAPKKETSVKAISSPDDGKLGPSKCWVYVPAVKRRERQPKLHIERKSVPKATLRMRTETLPTFLRQHLNSKE
jgi:hypothetical protein